MNAERIVERRWWVAVLLTFVGNSGYLYLGRPRRFFLFSVLAIVLSVAMSHGLWGVLASRLAMILWFLAAGGISIWVVAEQVLIARKTRNYHLRRYNRGWVYVLVFVLTFLVSSLAQWLVTGKVFPGNAVRSFAFPSGSMLPTIEVGDRFFVDMRRYEHDLPQRGDIVLYFRENGGDRWYASRVMGLPGERIQMVDGNVIINGVALTRERLEPAEATTSGEGVPTYREFLEDGTSYTVQEVSDNSSGDNTPAFEVPLGHYFMMGDNRDNSLDSRFEPGPVPAERIGGKAIWVYWSRKWSRIGANLD